MAFVAMAATSVLKPQEVLLPLLMPQRSLRRGFVISSSSAARRLPWHPTSLPAIRRPGSSQQRRGSIHTDHLMQPALVQSLARAEPCFAWKVRNMLYGAMPISMQKLLEAVNRLMGSALASRPVMARHMPRLLLWHWRLPRYSRQALTGLSVMG